jgi:uncharacterized protein
MSLIIKTSFISEGSIDKIWNLITDIEKSAPCFPGAVLGEKLPDGFYKGAFNIKLGPMTFNFAGKFGFIELQKENNFAKISATGTDVKGRGGAQGLIDVLLVEKDKKTEIQITSDVSLSGSVAQYGRGVGMIQAISQQLINEFAKNLSVMILPTEQETPQATTLTEYISVDKRENPQETNPPLKSENSVNLIKLLWEIFTSWLKRIFVNKI